MKRSTESLHKINVLTLQIVTDLLLHFLGFVFSATNQLWKEEQTMGDVRTADHMQLLLDEPEDGVEGELAHVHLCLDFQEERLCHAKIL